jgi:hypothetical protein
MATHPPLPSFSYRTHELEHALNLVECKGILVTPQYRTDNYEVCALQTHNMVLSALCQSGFRPLLESGLRLSCKEYRMRTCPVRFVQGRKGTIFWLRQLQSKRLQCWSPYTLHLVPHSLCTKLQSKRLILSCRPSWTSFFQSSTTRGRGSHCMLATRRRLGTSSRGPRPHTRPSSTLRYEYTIYVPGIPHAGKKWAALRGTFCIES